MILTIKDRMKRLEIAKDLLLYAEIMSGITTDYPERLIKNIYRDVDKAYKQNEYSQERFNTIRKHHFFASLIASFSYCSEECIQNLKWDSQEIGISENEIEKIFVDPTDIALYRNPMRNNELRINEILKYIRNALNHHENGELYKYIEREDAIEIDLKNVGTAHNGKDKKFHVKIPLKTLLKIVNALSEDNKRKSVFVIIAQGINCQAPDLKEQLKNKIRILRIVPKKDEKILMEILQTKKEDIEQKVEGMKQNNRIAVREYTYKDKAISDFQIDSIYEYYKMIRDQKYDSRVEQMHASLAYINALKLGTKLPDCAYESIAQRLGNIFAFPLGILTFDRFFASLNFNVSCIKTWNSSYLGILEKTLDKGIESLEPITGLNWYLLDPIERRYTEYENFIRYVIVNLAPIGKDNKDLLIKINGKEYNCTFLRNAFCHGKVAIVKNGDQYYYALYDTKKGMANEVSYNTDKNSKPQLYKLEELLQLASYLCEREYNEINSKIQAGNQEIIRLKNPSITNNSKGIMKPKGKK